MKQLSSFAPQYGATTCGYDRRRPLRKLGDDTCFYIAKSCLTFALKIAANAASNALLNEGIRVHKRPADPSGKLATNRGLAASRHTHQGNRSRLHKAKELPPGSAQDDAA